MTEKTGKQLNQYVKNYVVFDLETTGFNPIADEIIEISGIRVRNRKVTDTFSTLVNPLISIPYAATKVNGITDQMVQNAPTLHPVLEQFLQFIGTDILVGHNIHSFDMNFLSAAVQSEFGITVTNDYVDTLRLSKNCLPGLPHYRLTDIAKYFGIKTDGAHRALNDCTMNQQCYEKLGEHLKQRQNNSHPGQKEQVCPKCGCMLVKRNGKFGEFFGCSGFPMCRFTKNV